MQSLVKTLHTSKRTAWLRPVNWLEQRWAGQHEQRWAGQHEQGWADHHEQRYQQYCYDDVLHFFELFLLRKISEFPSGTRTHTYHCYRVPLLSTVLFSHDNNVVTTLLVGYKLVAQTKCEHSFGSGFLRGESFLCHVFSVKSVQNLLKNVLAYHSKSRYFSIIV